VKRSLGERKKRKTSHLISWNFDSSRGGPEIGGFVHEGERKGGDAVRNGVNRLAYLFPKQGKGVV